VSRKLNARRIKMSIFRRTDGFSNVEATNSGGAIPFPIDPEKWLIWVEDFVKFDIAQGDAVWTYDEVNDSDDAIIGPQGIVTITLGGAVTDSGGLFLTNAPFQLTAGKKAIFKSKVKVVKAAGTIGQEGFVVGLTSPQTGGDFMDAPPPTARTFDDGWCFLSYDAETNIDCMQGENDVFTMEASATTYADDTWMLLDIYWDGYKSTFYKDNEALVEITTNPPTSVVTPYIFFSAGEAQADVFHCDYLMVAIER
jgi:hypothetical protein